MVDLSEQWMGKVSNGMFGQFTIAGRKRLATLRLKDAVKSVGRHMPVLMVSSDICERVTKVRRGPESTEGNGRKPSWIIRLSFKLSCSFLEYMNVVFWIYANGTGPFRTVFCKQRGHRVTYVYLRNPPRY